MSHLAPRGDANILWYTTTALVGKVGPAQVCRRHCLVASDKNWMRMIEGVMCHPIRGDLMAPKAALVVNRTIGASSLRFATARIRTLISTGILVALRGPSRYRR